VLAEIAGCAKVCRGLQHRQNTQGCGVGVAEPKDLVEALLRRARRVRRSFNLGERPPRTGQECPSRGQ
jgi:hypothetical protein